METTITQESRDIVDSMLSLAERIEEEAHERIKPQLDRAALLRDKARELGDTLDAALPPKPNGKPPVNDKPKRGRKAKPATASRAPSKPRKERIDKDDADQAVIAELSQQDGIGQQAIADAAHLTYPQAGAALKRLVKAGRVSQEGKRNAKYLLQVAPDADVQLAEHIVDTADQPVFTDVQKRVLILLLAKKACDAKNDISFGDIEGDYKFEWGNDSAASLSPAVAQLEERLLVAVRLVGELHRYRLTPAGHAIAEQVVAPVDGADACEPEDI